MLLKCFGSLLLGLGCSLGFAAPLAAEVDFAHDVLPILKSHCAKCHTDGEYKGSFSMDTREALVQSDNVVVGDASKSEVIFRVLSDDSDEFMPPKGDRLTAEEVEVLEAWINEGLKWEEGFTFRENTWKSPIAPRRVELPGDSRGSPIDRVVDAYFAEHGVTPSPDLADAAFARRVSLDLIGVLPAPNGVRLFASDPSTTKAEAFVDSLLSRDEAYASHWMTFWNDLLRNDYSGTGFIDGGRKQITQWLYAALLENKPYDEFVRELIDATEDTEGFIKGIKWRGNVNASQVREIQFAQNISQVFLGENMKCASCHDSFINDWRLTDAYGLAAIIADEPLEIHRCDKPTGEKAVARWLLPELGDVDPNASREERLKQTAELMTSKQNGRFARTVVNRLWQRLMGRGLVEPVDIMGNRPWSEDLLDHLAWQFAEEGYDLKKLLKWIVLSKTYRRQSVEPHSGPVGEYVFRGPVAKRMTAEQFVDAVWEATGAVPGKIDAKVSSKPAVRASLVKSTLLMRALGRPNREQVVTTRPAELSTLQALELNNGKEFVALVEKGAESWVGRKDLVESLYWQLLSRAPTGEEATISREVLGEKPSRQTTADLLWLILLLPEFQVVQ